MPKKLTRDEFISRARAVHGDKYDYSQVEYTTIFSDVKIICPVHGLFLQTPQKHMKGQGCPDKECVLNKKKKTYMLRYGVDNPAKSDVVKDKIKNTNLERYGTENPMQNDDIKQKFFSTNIERYGHSSYSQTDEWKDKVNVTSNALYGADWYSQTDECKDKVKITNNDKYGADNIMQTDIGKEHMANTCRELYGVDSFMETDIFKSKSEAYFKDKYGVTHYSKTDEYKDKVSATMKQRYGSDSYFSSNVFKEHYDEYVAKAKQTNLEKYGAEWYQQSDDHKQRLTSILEKQYIIKNKNGSFNSSKSEDDMYSVLCDIFGKDDVIRQYHDDRYSFSCDFYIKSRDMFIELNASWTHGGHWYDTSDVEDISLFNSWNGKKTAYYNNAIHTWTELDVKKRNTASDSDLNYVVFWDKNLFDLFVWIDFGCPDGKDWDAMYSWLPNRIITNEFSSEFKGSKNNITEITKHFQFYLFFEKELRLWFDNSLYKHVPLQMYLYMNRFKYIDKLPSSLTDKEILRGFNIAGIYHSYTVFDVSLMEQVINKYDIKSVYDPCAGWGERLLCCYKHDVKYQGVDVNESLKPGYDNMIDTYGITNQSVVFEDSSVIDVSGFGDFDAVITCPPYFDTEIYSDMGSENFSYVDFLKWWNDVVKKSLNLNIKYFCFQINQKYKEDMVNVITSLGFKQVDLFIYKGKTRSSHFTRKSGKNLKKEYEEMLVFERI